MFSACFGGSLQIEIYIHGSLGSRIAHSAARLALLFPNEGQSGTDSGTQGMQEVARALALE